jgi:hypothetical protein
VQLATVVGHRGIVVERRPRRAPNALDSRPCPGSPTRPPASPSPSSAR